MKKGEREKKIHRSAPFEERSKNISSARRGASPRVKQRQLLSVPEESILFEYPVGG